MNRQPRIFIERLREVRDAEGGGSKLTGLAVPFNTETELYPGLRERFLPGSFTEAMGDVRFLVGHERGSLPLARTQSDTMSIWESERGVEFEASVDESTPHGQNALSAVRRGDIDGISIGFTGDGEYEREKDPDTKDVLISWTRVAQLDEISMVAFPAYPTTDVQVRAAKLFNSNEETSTMSSITSDSTVNSAMISTTDNTATIGGKPTQAQAQVRALVIQPSDTAEDLFRRCKDQTLPDDVRDTIFGAAVEAAQREAQEAQEAKADERVEERKEFEATPRQVRGGGANRMSAGIITGDRDREPTDEELRQRNDLAKRVAEQFEPIERFSNEEKSLLLRKTPGDQAFDNFLRSRTRNQLAEAERRLDAWEAHKTRAISNPMAAGTDADGGYTVPERLLPQLIYQMAATGPMADPAMTYRLVVSNGQELKIPTVTTSDSVESNIETESADIDAIKPTFGEVSLTPYKYARLLPASIEMVADTAIDLGAFVVRYFGIMHGRALNKAFTRGTGSSQPNGAFTGATAGTTLASKTAALVKADFEGTINVVDPAYATGNRYILQMTNASLGILRKLFDTGMYTFNVGTGGSGGYASFPGSLLGVPVYVNQALENGAGTSKKVFLIGNLDYYATVTVGQMRIDFSEHFGFGSGQVVYRGVIRADGDVLVADAFRSYTTPA